MRFSVSSGEPVGLVGESGSGKKTIARILLALEHAHSGEASVCGTKLSGPALPRQIRAELARQVQVVFQDPYASLNPARTIGAALGESIGLRQRALGRGADIEADEIAETLDMVGLPATYADRKPSALSG